MELITNIKKYWKWVFIFAFLPTLNGCQPSLGYPVSLSIREFSLVLFFLILIINLLFFIFFIKFIGEYFDKNKFKLKVFLVYFSYEGIITILNIFFPPGSLSGLALTGSSSLLLSSAEFSYNLGQFTLSWQVFLYLWGILGFGDGGPEPDEINFYIVKFIAMIILTLIVLLISIILQKLFVKKNDSNKIEVDSNSNI